VKITRSTKARTDVLELDTSAADGELIVTIVNGLGSSGVVSTQFALRKDIAQVLIKTLFDGMKLEDPEGTLPIYQIER